MTDDPDGSHYAASAEAESEIQTCDGCRLWDQSKAQPGYGQCQFPDHLEGKVKMSECWHDVPKGEYPPLVLIVEHAGKRYPASTHPKFGCPHWQPITEVPNAQ